MRRRKFITLLGGATTWPFAARAQPTERMRRIGVIMGFAEDDPVWQDYLATLRQRLRDFGWSEGRNVVITASPVKAPTAYPPQPLKWSQWHRM
jgi:hypothetical protein